MPYLFAVIGGGLTATSMLCQLMEKIRRSDRAAKAVCNQLEVVIFEKDEEFGPGFPHNQKNVFPFHITNMCARDMSVFYERPDDFQEWVFKQRDALKKKNVDDMQCLSHGKIATEGCFHYPRSLMGEYLKNRFQSAIEAANTMGISVNLQKGCEVVDLSFKEKNVILTVFDNKEKLHKRWCADGALIATGHWSTVSNDSNYFSSPWPASKLLTAIPKKATVAVLGSSLSAIEAALTLSSDGQFRRLQSGRLQYRPPALSRKIIFYSRNGYLPRVRGNIGKQKNHYFTVENIRELIDRTPGKVRLKSAFKLLNLELERLYGKPIVWQKVIAPQGNVMETLQHDIDDARYGDGHNGELLWQTALVQCLPIIRDLYFHLSLEEKKKFDQNYSTIFFMHAATMPIINAEKLLALMKAGIVSIIKLGRDYQLQRNRQNGEFEFIYSDDQAKKRIGSVRYVINATGQRRSIETDPSLLTQNLLKKKMVQIAETRHFHGGGSEYYKTGSMVVDPKTHRVSVPAIADGFYTSPSLFAVGAMTRGQMIDASMAHGLSRSTATIAEWVLNQVVDHTLQQ